MGDGATGCEPFAHSIFAPRGAPSLFDEDCARFGSDSLRPCPRALLLVACAGLHCSLPSHLKNHIDSVNLMSILNDVYSVNIIIEYYDQKRRSERTNNTSRSSKIARRIKNGDFGVNQEKSAICRRNWRSKISTTKRGIGFRERQARPARKAETEKEEIAFSVPDRLGNYASLLQKAGGAA
jgi:hypothetical protein